MSKLAVGSLEGLASEGYKISVASGSKLVQAGAVLQVVQTVKTDTFSTASTSFVDITGLTVSITPTSTSSKVLVLAHMMGSFYQVGAVACYVRLRRDSTEIFYADAASNRERVSTMAAQVSNAVMQQMSITYLDSPNTTSAITYKPVIRGDGATVFVNRSAADADSANNPRGASSLIALEIAG